MRLWFVVAGPVPTTTGQNVRQGQTLRPGIGEGVVLAGGRASRLPGKPLVELGGRPLISYPIAAMRSAGLAVTVVGKSDATDLKAAAELEGAAWLGEPQEPVHPLLGIATALRATGRPVVVCAADMPFVTTELIAHLNAIDCPAAGAVVCEVDGFRQPLLATYTPGTLAVLEQAVGSDGSAQAALVALGGRLRVLAGSDLKAFGDPRRLVFDIDDDAALTEALAVFDRPVVRREST